jgi:hypothetical protein
MWEVSTARGWIYRIVDFGTGAVLRDLFAGKQPGVQDGEVGRHDGEEEQEDADDFRDVEGVIRLENKGQNNQTEDGSADDDTGYGLRPRFLIAGKHFESPFV